MYKKYSKTGIIIAILITIIVYQHYKNNIYTTTNNTIAISKYNYPIEHISHLLHSQRLMELIHALDQLPDTQLPLILPTIVSHLQQTISESELVGLILEIADNHKNNPLLYDTIVKLLPPSIDYAQCLYEIAKKKSPIHMPLLIGWIKKITHSSPPAGYGFQNAFEHALTKAVLYNDFDILEFFIAYGVRLNIRKASELLMIVIYEEKNPLFIPFLIKRGADINQVGPDGHTLISHAVYSNNINAARLLLESGAYPRQSTHSLETELITIARNHNQKAMIDLLNEYCTD